MNALSPVPSAAAVARQVVLVAGLLAAALPAAAQSTQPTSAPVTATQSHEPGQVALAVLERAYMDCDRVASERVLGLSEAMACSQVSEALLQRAFHGDFNRMLAWWREQRAQRLAEKAALEAP